MLCAAPLLCSVFAGFRYVQLSRLARLGRFTPCFLSFPLKPKHVLFPFDLKTSSHLDLTINLPPRFASNCPAEGR